MDTREYNRLLMQMLLLPLLAILVFAAGLGYSLQRMQKSAAWVDHSDRLIAHGNRLLRLIVDEETGIRGYFLSGNPAFLEPYESAQQLLPREFDSTLAMTRDNPDQVARLWQLQRDYTEWNELTRRSLVIPIHGAVDIPVRKQQMDGIRADAQRFVEAEQLIRHRRSIIAENVGSLARWLLLGLLGLIALLIALATKRAFSACARIFAHQLIECDNQRILAAEGEQRLDTMLRSIGDGVIACDPEGRVVLMNPVAEQLTGWREQDAKKLPLPDVFQIVNQHTQNVVENPVERALRNGETVGLGNHTILIRKNGSECAIEDSASPIRAIDGRIAGVVLVFRDSTERRNSETALMRAEKLAAAGKLAASIAHEVNNPLEGLMNVLYLASESQDLNEVREWMTQAQAEVNRLSHITRRTLGFYRESSKPTAYRPSDVVEEVLSFYVPEASSKKVELEAQIRTERKIYGVPGELRQVLSNLISNSFDAMPEGGSVRLVVREASDLHDSTRKGVRITVADNGGGIPRHVLEHVFEPFFTTKLETGTGLGLWVSKELIEKQGGRLGVRSSMTGGAIGTVFSIYIPVEDDIRKVPQDEREKAQI